MSRVARYPRIRTAEIAAKSMDCEVVAINISTGVYYSLDGVAGRLWAYFEAGWDVEGTVKAIATEYGVTESRVAADVEAFVSERRAAPRQ